MIKFCPYGCWTNNNQFIKSAKNVIRHFLVDVKLTGLHLPFVLGSVKLERKDVDIQLWLAPWKSEQSYINSAKMGFVSQNKIHRSSIVTGSVNVWTKFMEILLRWDLWNYDYEQNKLKSYWYRWDLLKSEQNSWNFHWDRIFKTMHKIHGNSIDLGRDLPKSEQTSWTFPLNGICFCSNSANTWLNWPASGSSYLTG